MMSTTRRTCYKNPKLAGTWRCYHDENPKGGRMTITDGIFWASFTSQNVHCEELRIIESKSNGSVVIFRGDTDRWDNCHHDFVIELKLVYNADLAPDTIQGVVNISPLHKGPALAYWSTTGPSRSSGNNGGSFSFIATRE